MKITKKVYAAVSSALVVVGAIVAINAISTDAQALGTTSTRRDCTSEDIIYCGALTQTELLQDYDKNDGDVQAIFTYFGIKRTDLAGTTSEMKMGKLKLDGTIVVDGKTVATDAQSTYRIRTKSWATTFTVNGKTYYKLPVKGVYYKEADVFVMFKNGQFFQAVQTSCGNIITAKPVKPPVQPVYSCDSLQATKITRTEFKFTSAATAKNGAEIVNYTYDFGDGKKQTTGATVNHTYAKPGNYTVTVTINVKVNGATKAVTSEKCKVTIKVEEAPVTPTYACELLKAEKINRNTIKFTTTATAKNAQIVSYTYNFGDGKTETVTSPVVNHTYVKPGNYTIFVTVNVKVDGVNKTATSDKCKVTIKIEPVPVKPMYACNSLTARIVKAETRTYEYALVYTAEGGATLNKVVYNFGDSTSQTYAAAQASKVQHSYAKAGSYKTTATLYFNVNDGTKVVEKTISCEVSINTTPDNCPMPGKEHLPKDSPECAEKPEVCEMPGKQHLPKDSPECVETPPELPKTGLGGMLSGGLGLGSLVAAGYYWVNSRKSLITALYKR